MKKFFLLLFCAAFSVTMAARMPVRIACVGDSITWGAGVDDPSQSSYPAVLQKLMGDGYEVRNFGMGGRVVSNTGDYPYMKEEMYAELKAYLPDVVVIMLGTNDTKPHNWNPEQFEKDYSAMFNELRAIDSHPDIYFCYPPAVVHDSFGINEKLVVEGVMPLIGKVAGSNYDVIDIHSVTAGRPELFVKDGVHPNNEGAAVIAGTVAETLARNGYGKVPGTRLLFIGDSITDGEWGGGRGRASSERNHYDYNHVYGHGYQEMCIARLAADYPDKGMVFYNRGISGNTLAKIEKRWDSDVLAVHPDIISVYVGINDTHDGTVDDYDYAGWDAKYRSLLDRTLAVNPDVKFVLCSPFVSDCHPEYARRAPIIARLAGIVKRISEDYGCCYVDTHGLMNELCTSGVSNDHRYWTWDGVHPTTAGHQKIADLWLKTVGKTVLMPMVPAQCKVDVRKTIEDNFGVKSEDLWYGFRRTKFEFMGYTAWVVEPDEPLKEIDGARPWTWTMQWADAFVDRTGVLDLLRKGFHHVTIEAYSTRANDEALPVFAEFQKFLVDKLGFDPQANLVGLSWGGFYSIRYTNAFPQNVRKIYLDCPLLNFQDWEADNERKVGSWALCPPADGRWENDPRMPVNMAESVAKAGISVLLIYGGQDRTVDPKLNCELFIERFKAVGGDISVQCNGANGHHPHGLDPDKTQPVVNFFDSPVK